MNRPLRFSSVPELHWPPGSTLGLMGGGQLGRMMAMAAARMGYRTHVFTDQQHTPAGEVAAAVTVASFSDQAALERFANSVQVVTYEFENVPLAAAKVVAERVAVRPAPNVLAIAQDRLAEKNFLSNAALPVAPYRGIETPEELQLATAVGFPAVLKTRREGYDGKGQVRVKSAHDLSAAWDRLGHVPVVLERWIDFACEVSVIIARSQDGEEAAYEPAENRHAGGILRTSIVPALISQSTAEAAVSAARTVVRELDCVGVLAVEMFVLADGGVVVNEIAPRPHNSGHWTIDAAETSQFEQQVRVCCGLPLGSVDRLHDAVMENMIGNDADAWSRYLGDGSVRLHLYGKKISRPGRKMGHVTRLFPHGSSPRAFDEERSG